MADFLRLISTLKQQMSATLSRSDILRPLAGLIGILITAIILIIVAKGPEWLLILMSVVWVFSIVLYFFTYVFCLFRDRDALRSEKYSLQKMAIEHGLFGDSTSGTFEPEETNAHEIESSTKQIEHQS
jgi:membrane protein YdbS with pleckstrin-like domain